MNQPWLKFGAATILSALALAFTMFGSTASPLGVRAQAAPTPAPSGDEVAPPPLDRAATAFGAPATLDAAPIPLVYFTPQDSDANATVLNIYNTSTVTQSVSIRGYGNGGGLVYSLNLPIPAGTLIHAVSDSVVASPPPSWANAIVVNFTDFTMYASMAMPAGVKVDGYVVFNAGTGTVDPRADQGAIPLRLSADPPTIFLAAVQRTP